MSARIKHLTNNNYFKDLLQIDRFGVHAGLNISSNKNPKRDKVSQSFYKYYNHHGKLWDGSKYIKGCNKRYLNYYMSLNTFRHFKRGTQQVIGLNANYLDLDIEKESGIIPKKLLKDNPIHRVCKLSNIPLPTFCVDSGHGLHLIWAYNKQFYLGTGHKYFKTDWLRIQDWLSKKVDDGFASIYGFLPVDTSVATDIARVLRVPNTYNNKRDKNGHKRPRKLCYQLKPLAKKYDMLDLYKLEVAYYKNLPKKTNQRTNHTQSKKISVPKSANQSHKSKDKGTQSPWKYLYDHPLSKDDNKRLGHYWLFVVHDIFKLVRMRSKNEKLEKNWWTTLSHKQFSKKLSQADFQTNVHKRNQALFALGVAFRHLKHLGWSDNEDDYHKALYQLDNMFSYPLQPYYVDKIYKEFTTRNDDFYNYNRGRLINVLRITPQEQAHLSTLHGSKSIAKVHQKLVRHNQNVRYSKIHSSNRYKRLDFLIENIIEYGLNESQTARALKISRRTVIRHLKGLLQRLLMWCDIFSVAQ